MKAMANGVCPTVIESLALDHGEPDRTPSWGVAAVISLCAHAKDPCRCITTPHYYRDAARSQKSLLLTHCNCTCYADARRFSVTDLWNGGAARIVPVEDLRNMTVLVRRDFVPRGGLAVLKIEVV